MSILISLAITGMVKIFQIGYFNHATYVYNEVTYTTVREFVIRGDTLMKNQKTLKIILTGVMAALSFIAYEFFRIPFGNTGTSFHLGNTFAALGGLLLGPIYGGLGGSIGLSLADFIAGDFVYVPTTFLLKFIIGSVTGLLSHKLFKIKTLNGASNRGKLLVATIVSAGVGLLQNVITDPCLGYVRDLVLGYETSVAKIGMKIAGGITLANSLVSLIIVVIFYLAIRPALKKSGLFPDDAS